MTTFVTFPSFIIFLMSISTIFPFWLFVSQPGNGLITFDREEKYWFWFHIHLPLKWNIGDKKKTLRWRAFMFTQSSVHGFIEQFPFFFHSMLRLIDVQTNYECVCAPCTMCINKYCSLFGCRLLKLSFASHMFACDLKRIVSSIFNKKNQYTKHWTLNHMHFRKISFFFFHLS